ncbi:RidA family protein [Aspergillus affinis]|uniref:RidA family protein n=1 Tax=Aspergillus affinis TaxID=1070780 RepID=UPI0022FEEDE1|nr:uncharacterized protein KD926_005664 [Aspergillus affinis]KAI9042369.1 hypothetical protein KD926_005664 [Aspergillus affinis]
MVSISTCPFFSSSSQLPWRTALPSTPLPLPRPFPQYSQAVKYNGLVYCNGSIGIDPRTDELVPGTVTDRAHMALQNLEAIVKTAGSGMNRVLKVNVFLSDMDDFDGMNEAWDQFFPEDPKPCRTCVEARQLPLGTDVEIEMIASYDLE